MRAEPGRTAIVPLPAEGHGSRRNQAALSVRQLTANQSAALLLVARDLLRQHELVAPSVSEVLTAAGAGRSQSYHGKNEVILAMADVLSRPRGRPRIAPAPEPDTRGVALKVLRFVLDHPGSLTGGLQRRGYRNDFKRFVLELRQRHSRLGLQEFSDAIGISVHTIKEWAHEDARLPKVPVHGGRARRCEARKERLKRLVEILHQKPSGFGINRASWTQETLIIAYRQKHGESLCRATLASLIKATGFRWKRARRVLTSPDPEYREKVELVLSTLQNLKSNELFFFVDELGPVRVKRFGGRAFVPRHETPVVPQVQHHRGSITMAGALSATANRVTWMYGAAKDSRSMIDLIEVLYCQHPDAARLFLTWDAAAWHRSRLLSEWLDEFNAETQRSGCGPVIDLVPLPSSAQFLDVLEAVFSGMKRAVIHHSDYRREVDMKAAISQHFAARNTFFRENPRRAGKKIWEVDFFADSDNLRSGNYREW